MSSIQTGIELQDNFTGVMYGIINSVNLAISSVEEMSQAMNADIDTSSLEGARMKSIRSQQHWMKCKKVSIIRQHLILPRQQ